MVRLDTPAQVEAVAAGKELDTSVLTRLAEDCGADVLPEIAEAVEAEAREALAALALAVAAACPEGAARAAHALKGNAASVGLVRVAGAAGRIEAAARRGLVPDRAAVAALALGWQRAYAAFEGFLAPFAGREGMDALVMPARPGISSATSETSSS